MCFFGGRCLLCWTRIDAVSLISRSNLSNERQPLNLTPAVYNYTVDSTRALLSLSKAIHYSTCKEATSFLESAGAKLTSVLLEHLDIGNLSSREEDAFRSCIKSALKIVALDLADKSTTLQSCNTLSFFTVLFDEVSECEDNNFKRTLLDSFRNEKGFTNLANYLRQLVGTETFPLSTMPAILNVLEFEQRNGPKVDASLPTTILSHLNSLDEVQLSDDSIDICQRTSALAKHCLTPLDTAKYYSLLQDFVLKLIKSSSVPLKLLGLAQIPELIADSIKNRPRPIAFIAQGAGIDIVNGIYIEDPYEPEEDKEDSLLVVYSYDRNVYKPECDMTVTLTLHRDIYMRWCLTELDDDEGDTNHYIHDEWDKHSPPRSGWKACGFRSSNLKFTPAGFMIPSGEEFVCQELNFWEWVAENNVLDLIGKDRESAIEDVRDEATNAGHKLLCSLGPLLDWIIEMIAEPLEEEPELHRKRDQFYEVIVGFSVRLLGLLLGLSDETLHATIPDFVLVTIERIGKILERIGTADSQFEYNIFNKLLILRLKTICGEPLNIEIDEIPGLALKPSQAFIVSDTSFITSGRYTLDDDDSLFDSRFATYRKEGREYGDCTLKQQLFGADKGKWFISRRRRDQPADEETVFINASMTPTPPQSGWLCTNGTWFGDTKVDPIGLAEDQESTSHSVQKVLSVGMNAAQNKLWTVIQSLSTFVASRECDRSLATKADIERCMASLHEYRTIELHFLKHAVSILQKITPESRSTKD